MIFLVQNNFQSRIKNNFRIQKVPLNNLAIFSWETISQVSVARHIPLNSKKNLFLSSWGPLHLSTGTMGLGVLGGKILTQYLTIFQSEGNRYLKDRIKFDWVIWKLHISKFYTPNFWQLPTPLWYVCEQLCCSNVTPNTFGFLFKT